MKKTKTTIQSLGVILIALVSTSCKIVEPYTLELSDEDKEFLVFEKGEHFMLKNEQTNEKIFFTVDTIFFDTIVDGNIITEEVEGYIETARLKAFCDSCSSDNDTCEGFEGSLFSLQLVKKEKGLLIVFIFEIDSSGNRISYTSGNQIFNEEYTVQSVLVDNLTYEYVYVFNSNLSLIPTNQEMRVYFSKIFGIIKVERITTGELLFTIAGP